MDNEKVDEWDLKESNGRHKAFTRIYHMALSENRMPQKEFQLEYTICPIFKQTYIGQSARSSSVILVSGVGMVRTGGLEVTFAAQNMCIAASNCLNMLKSPSEMAHLKQFPCK